MIDHDRRPRSPRLARAFGFAALWIVASLASAQPFAYLPIEDNDEVQIVDTATDQVIAIVPLGDRPAGVAIHPDGSTVFIGNGMGGTVSVIDVATQSVVDTIPFGQHPVGMVVHPEGHSLYVVEGSNMGGFVGVYDTTSFAELDRIELGGLLQPHGMAMSPNGDLLYVSLEVTGELVAVDTFTHLVVDTTSVGGRPMGVAVTPSGDKIYVANRMDGTVSVVDAATFAELTAVPTGESPYALTAHPDGSAIYVTNRFSKSVSRIDPTTDTVTGEATVGEWPSGVAVHPDGERVYVVSNHSGDLAILDRDLTAVLDTVPLAVGAAGFGHFITPGATGPTLSVSGSCPGLRTITVEGVEPAGRVALMRDLVAGPGEVMGGPCAGTSMDLDRPRMMALLTADPAGVATFDIQLPASRCGMLVQALEVPSCTTSNRESL